MACLSMTLQGLALLRSVLLMVVLLALTSVGKVSGDCVPTEGNPCKVEPGAWGTFWVPQRIEESEPSPSKVDNSPTLRETSSSDSITSQPDSPALPMEDSSSTQPLKTTSNSAESITLPTDDASDNEPLSSCTTKSEGMVSSSTEKSETTPPSGSTNYHHEFPQPVNEVVTVLHQITQASYGPPPVCHPPRNFPFAHKLWDDPCRLIITGRAKLQKINITAGLSNNDVKGVYEYLIGQIKLIKNEVDNTLNHDTMNICTEVSWPPVAKIPTLDELIPLSTGEILFLYYSSLVNHTAHLEFLVHLLESYDITCSKNNIRVSTRRHAFESLKFSCLLRLLILAVYDDFLDEHFDKPTKEVMELNLCDPRYCSRRAIYDCQVVTSFQTILIHLGAFLEKPDTAESIKKWNPKLLKEAQEL